MRRTIICIVFVLCCSSAYAQTTNPTIQLSFDFRDGSLGWQPGFADYPPETNIGDFYALVAELRQLPSNIGSGTGFFFQGDNHSDDLFMFLKRRLTQADGIVAGQRYDISYTLVFASSACTNCGGIGGHPGLSVYVKAGAAPIEPIPYGRDQRMNVDKGNQSQGGIAATVAGTIADGLPDDRPFPFYSLTLTHQHTTQVTANSSGELWLLAGTDSGFEGRTQLFYQRIDVKLVPVGSSAPAPAPKLLTEENTGRAIALNAVNLTREPFAQLTRSLRFDEQTRVVVFATDLELLPGEDASAVSAQIEDSQQRVMQAQVEFVGKVQNFESLTQVVIKLPLKLLTDGTKISISLRGTSSNSVPFSYQL